MSPPLDPDGYTHRSGRTGRAGRRGRSLLLVPPRAQRHITRLLASLRIDADWQAAPGPSKVRKAITKRTRKQLHARLDAEPGPAEKTVEYARQLLLEGRDPATVIATLLELAEPRLPCEPREVQPIAPLRDHEREPAAGARSGERDGGPRRASREPWGAQRQAPGRRPRDDRFAGSRRGAERRDRSS